MPVYPSSIQIACRWRRGIRKWRPSRHFHRLAGSFRRAAREGARRRVELSMSPVVFCLFWSHRSQAVTKACHDRRSRRRLAPSRAVENPSERNARGCELPNMSNAYGSGSALLLALLPLLPHFWVRRILQPAWLVNESCRTAHHWVFPSCATVILFMVFRGVFSLTTLEQLSSAAYLL